MRPYIVDASTVAKWYFPEEWSDRAAALLEQARSGSVGLIAPELLLCEMGSVVLKKLRKHQVKLGDAEATLYSLADMPVQLVPSVSFVSAALALAAASGASFYDAIYLVTARESGGILVTNDAALARQARASGMSSLVTLLSDLTC